MRSAIGTYKLFGIADYIKYAAIDINVAISSKMVFDR